MALRTLHHTVQYSATHTATHTALCAARPIEQSRAVQGRHAVHGVLQCVLQCISECVAGCVAVQYTATHKHTHTHRVHGRDGLGALLSALSHSLSLIHSLSRTLIQRAWICEEGLGVTGGKKERECGCCGEGEGNLGEGGEGEREGGAGVGTEGERNSLGFGFRLGGVVTYLGREGKEKERECECFDVFRRRGSRRLQQVCVYTYAYIHKYMDILLYVKVCLYMCIIYV